MFLDVVGPIIVLLVIGFAAKEIGLLDSSRVDILNKLAFYVALPALVFYSTYSRSLKEIFSLPLVLAFCLVILSTLIVGWFVHKRIEKNSRRSVATIQSYHGNIGYMGLPIVTMALEEAAGAKASLLLGVGSIIQILLTIIILIYLNTRQAEITKEITKGIINPVVLALVAGILFSYFGLSLPNLMEESISILSEAALPIALLGVGASIELARRVGDLPIIGSVIGLKMILMPLLGWIAFSAFGVGGVAEEAGILMLGMPTAVSTFIYAKELGGDARLASLNISLTTILSILTISVMLLIF
ncbi:hypothetical protein AKJ53_01880 [candidate division MSBL1 archaeon SCGC-AAA382F02]|uniref:Transporter n=1 Tax=candidate division MSBL1 archaeon SCGC-AAA382F02 TaxID=1698282 RepID=A0A133VHC5_9EURY|nr:hypothetical protein AKJ53_01880 [candidate division MSBL1 archaeon SCGC-AAA382F02]